METMKHTPARRTPPRGRSRAPLLAGAAIAVFMCLLLAILLGYLVLAPRSLASGPGGALILTPADGDQLARSASVIVQASASHADGVRRVELYADGALIAAQESALQDGSRPLNLYAAWVPLTVGRHILMARAYTLENQHFDSLAIHVNVVEPGPQVETINTGAGSPSAADIAASTGASAEDILEANPGLPPDPGAPIPPGTDVEVPLPPPADPPPADPPPPMPGAPAAPTGLAVTADCATAQLTWTDAADEQQYVVYRLDPPVLTPIATLAAGSTSHADPLPGLGMWSYQVASVKDGLESLTPLVSASTPAECVPPLPPPAAIADLTLSMDTLVADAVWDGAYCYFDINGTGYQRVPAAAFSYLTPEPDGVTYDLAAQLPDGGSYHVTADSTVGLTLSGECWGRSGPSVELLGEFSAAHGPDDWDGDPLSQSAYLFGRTGHASPNRAPNVAVNYTINTAPPGPGDFWLLPGWIDLIFGLLQLPAPDNLRVENTFDACDAYVGFDYLGCILDGLGTGGYPTFLWDWTGSAFHSEDQLTSYLVTMRARDVGTGYEALLHAASIVRVGSDPIPTSWPLPADALPCGSQIILTVQAFKAAQASTVSEIMWQETPACGAQTIQVKFDTFALHAEPGHPPFGDVGGFCFLCDDTRLEYYGRFGVNDAYFPVDSTSPTCPSSGSPGDHWCLSEGDYPVSSLEVTFLWFTITGLDTISLPFVPGETIDVYVALSERDGGSYAPGAICIAHQEFPAAASPLEWATLNAGTHTIGGTSMQESASAHEGACSMTFTLSLVGGP